MPLVDSYCESACVLVALYGSTLHVTPEAKFGFHRGRSVARNESELGQDIARQGTNSLISKFEELGVPEHILEMAEKTPPYETYYVSGSELFREGVARLVEK